MLIVVAGIALWGQRAAPLTPTEPGQAGMIGLAMVFILLTYGGWNETAYLSAEMRGSTRRIASAFFWGIGLITLVYLLANAAMLWGLGWRASPPAAWWPRM
jgi:amino acid transporter